MINLKQENLLAEIMNDRTNLWYFESVDLFEVLCPHKVKDMAETHQFNQYKKDEFIYFPNEPSKYIYMVADGRVKIGTYTEDGKEMVKSILSKGEIFGELALTGEERRIDSVSTDCRLEAFRNPRPAMTLQTT